MSDMPKDLKKVQHEAEELKMQLLYQEHYSRRENLMFLGIQEMMRRSTPKARRKIITWRRQKR